MAFDFFNISKNLWKDFKGIAGSRAKPSITLCFKQYEEGNPREINVVKTINNLPCLITDLSNRERLAYQTYAMEGRKMMSFRFLDKTAILKLINQPNFNAMKNNDSYITWNGEKYSIIAFLSYTNANMIRFIGVYGGDNS